MASGKNCTSEESKQTKVPRDVMLQAANALDCMAQGGSDVVIIRRNAERGEWHISGHGEHHYQRVVEEK